MAGEFRLTKRLGVRGIDRDDCAAPIPDVEPSGRRVVADIIGVVAEADHRTASEVVAVQQLQAFALAVRHADNAGVERYGYALRLTKAAKTLQMATRLQVEHFDGVVPERRDEQTLVSGIECQVIDSS